MNISPVSFRSTTASKTDFNSLINRPQAFPQTQVPVASSPIESKEGKKKSPLKAILGVVVAALGVAAGIAVGTKKGLFLPKEGGLKIVEQIKPYLTQAGDKILEVSGKLLESAKTLIQKFKPQA